MSDDVSTVQPQPIVRIDIREGAVTIDGTPIEPDDPNLHKAAVHAVARRVAQPLQRPVRSIASDHNGRVAMIVYPDGHASGFTPIPDGMDTPWNDDTDTPPTPPPTSTRESRRNATRTNPNRAPLSPPSTTPINGLHVGSTELSGTDLSIPDPKFPSTEVKEPPSHELPPAVQPSDSDSSSSESRALPSVATTVQRQLSPPDTPLAHPPVPEKNRSNTDTPSPVDLPAYPTMPGPNQAPQFPMDGVDYPAVAPPGTDTASFGASSRSFLPEQLAELPAQRGWRGMVSRFGFNLEPSENEKAERADVQAISRHWPGPRTIAIVNGKGGAGKTPATVILSALFATHGGTGVLAWDNNETRGTLGWRTEPGNHQRHVLDFLRELNHFASPQARLGDLAGFLHHQTHDKYEVLRSNPLLLPHEQRITEQDFDAIHHVMTRYFRLIFVDSGNDETAPHWLRMIDRSDHIVVATTTRPDHAEAGRLLLETLRRRDERSATLAANAVVIVSQADREEASADSIADGFEGVAREAITVPYDKAMRAPWLHLSALAPATVRAYLAAAAAISDGLGTPT